MRKSTLWVLLALSAAGAMVLFGCSQQSPLQSGDTVSTPGVASPSNDGVVIPGEYIVVLKPGESRGLGKRVAADALKVAAAVGAKPQNVYATVLNGFSGKLTPDQYQALLNNPSVDYIEPNRTIHMMAQTVPWGISKVNAPLAHARGVRGATVKVGVIDTGIDYNHGDLAANYAGGIDYVNGDSNPMDDNGHGTHVSGTIAAIDNTVGVLGVAPSCRLYGVKVLNSAGSGTFANVIAGIDWCAANGMQVANMSLGASSGTTALQTACDNAYAAGVVICAAAGNGYGAPVSYPAAYSSCVAVSATDQNNNLAVFSNFGSQVDVAAPGVSIYSTYPGNSYATMDGTSMATPHAAGVCALIWSTGSYTTASAVRTRLTSTCTDIGAAGFDNYFGDGLINADAATAGGGGGNQPPVANANGPYSGTAGTAVSFSSAGSSDPDGSIASYSWSFGDGGTSTLANPTHTYAAAGTYNVSLTVTDNLGATGSNSTTATISSGANQPPVANANGPYSGTAGTAVAFSSAGSSDPDGTIASYAWSFGDGGTSTLANPTHTYAAAGTYNVSLTVTDNLGAT
ncbi:MAG: S8 family serine peptidase, partial [candidate division Zixibacteria bacterium]|nr:S8 family serine peptidase [candidate division Zixibacteria bacterium]